VQAWTSADCKGGGHPSLRVTTSPASGLSAGFSSTGANQNVVVYEDAAWPYEPNALAKTVLGLNLDSGDILDSDLAINSGEYPFTLNPATSDEVDVLAVLTHEIGHFLGLAHSDAPGATMQPEVKGFATLELESLEPDDMAGICAIYPPGAQAELPAPPLTTQSCAVSRGRPAAPVSSLVEWGALLGALALRRRTKR
jgi:hypothetical protein